MRQPLDLRAKKHSLSRLMAEASNATGFETRTAPGFDAPTSIVPVPAVAGGWVSLDSEFIAAKSAHPGVTFAPDGNSETRLDAFLAKSSRVAQAGAALIVVNSQPPAGMTAGADALALYARPTNFRVIEPAGFAYLETADPSIATLPALEWLRDQKYPVSDAELRMSDAPSHGFRVRVSRKQQSMFSPELVDYELAKAIALGIAQQADETLLGVLRIAAETNQFSLGAAAAKNLKFDELRAFVGTAGAGAAVGQDGILRVSGVPAELTGTVSPTIIGAFNRAAVAVSDEMHLLIQRVNVSGDLIVTAFVQVRALVPDRGYFWKP